jgi:hypothetical protein
MKPESQKRVARPSTPTRTKRTSPDSATRGSFQGRMMSAPRERMDQTEEKTMKFTSWGEIWRQCEDHQEATEYELALVISSST